MFRQPVLLLFGALAMTGAACPAPAEGPAPAVEPSGLPSPIPASLEQVLDAQEQGWRTPSVEVYRWNLFPDIVILDTAEFAFQDRTFARLAYFLEKRGFRGRLLSNAQLAGRHGWNAHDYGAAGLAAFFSAAEASSFPLNAEEIALRQLAADQGMITASRGGWIPGRGGVLSISRSSSRIERRLLLTHESFHGIFFSSPEYRGFCQDLWASLSVEEKGFYESFLDSTGYDITDPTLVVNEFQAYLMQQPKGYAASYFERFLRLQERPGSPPPVAAWQLLRNAEELDAFTRARFGFGAGGELLASLGKASS